MQLKELGLTTANAAAQSAAGLNIKQAVSPVLYFIEEAASKGLFSVEVEADLVEKKVIIGPGPGNTISVIELLRSLSYVVGEKKDFDGFTETKENKYIITWGL